MALVTSGYRGQVSVVDNGGNVASKTYELRSVDFATAVIDMATIVAALQGVTDGIISAYTISEVFKEDAFVYPVSNVENENKASVSVLLTTVGAKKANFKIPAPRPAIFQGTTGTSANIVDITNAAMIAYANLFKAGAEAYISDGEDLSQMLSGKRISAKKNFG